MDADKDVYIKQPAHNARCCNQHNFFNTNLRISSKRCIVQMIIRIKPEVRNIWVTYHTSLKHYRLQFLRQEINSLIWRIWSKKKCIYRCQNVFGGLVGIGSCNRDNLRASKPPRGNCFSLLPSPLLSWCPPILQICPRWGLQGSVLQGN